jgi:hypothetical protein
VSECVVLRFHPANCGSQLYQVRSFLFQTIVSQNSVNGRGCGRGSAHKRTAAERMETIPICHGDVVKAATALNNAGVRLLARYSFVEACLSFKEGTKLMKNLAGFLDGQVSTESLLGQLQRARELISRFNTVQVPFGSLSYTLFPSPIVLKAISSEYSPSSFHSAIAASINTSVTKFAFTIDLSPSEFSNDESINVDYYSAIILYNHGVAYDCLAATSTTTVARLLFQQKATRIFYLTSSLVELQFKDEWGNPKTRIADGRILQLQSFVTFSLMQACVAFNLPSEYYMYCSKLEETLVTIDILEQILSSKEHCAAVA